MKYKLITIHGFIALETNNKKDIFKFMSGQPKYYKDKFKVYFQTGEVYFYPDFYNINHNKGN